MWPPLVQTRSAVYGARRGCELLVKTTDTQLKTKAIPDTHTETHRHTHTQTGALKLINSTGVIKRMGGYVVSESERQTQAATERERET